MDLGPTYITLRLALSSREYRLAGVLLVVTVLGLRSFNEYSASLVGDPDRRPLAEILYMSAIAAAMAMNRVSADARSARRPMSIAHRLLSDFGSVVVLSLALQVPTTLLLANGTVPRHLIIGLLVATAYVAGVSSLAREVTRTTLGGNSLILIAAWVLPALLSADSSVPSYLAACVAPVASELAVAPALAPSILLTPIGCCMTSWLIGRQRLAQR